MGNCNSCCGEEESSEQECRHGTSRYQRRESKNCAQACDVDNTYTAANVEGTSGLSLTDANDTEMRRVLVSSAIEERIKQMETRGGAGTLSKKLATQPKSTSSARLTKNFPTNSDVKKIDEALCVASFEYKIPLNRSVFAGGDGNSVEDSPIGYYRFHFWRADEHWKEHENWISNTDLAGPMCVSLLSEEQPLGKRTFYRMLFRSIFGNKSVVLCEDDVSSQFFGKKKLTRHQVLGIGLREFINHEKDKVSTMEDDVGAMSIRTNCSVASISNDLVRTLPSSRLREASGGECSNYSNLSRTMSVKGSISRMDDESITNVAATEKSGVIRKKFRDLCSINAMELVKSFTQVKDKDFYHVLLNLEKALDPKVCHFDVIIADGSNVSDRQRDGSWQSFTRLLGDKLTKAAFHEQSLFLAKQGRVPSEIMSELILERRKYTSAAEKTTPAGEETPALMALRLNLIADFIMNEINYLNKLQMIDEYFLGPMNPHGQGPDPKGVRGLMHAEDYKFIFEGFPAILGLHQKMLKVFLDGTGIQIEEAPSRHVIMEQVKDGVISGKLIAKVLLWACKEKEFAIYADICDDFYERSRMLKKLCDTRPEFHDYIEFVAHDPRSNKLTIDQVMGNIFQIITRYALQLKSIIAATAFKDESIPLLEEAILKLDDTVVYIEHFKKRRDDTTNLFSIQRSIANCPPNLCQLRRIFLMKMAAYEVEKGEVNFAKRLTLFLFNDMLIGARKKRSKEGKLDQNHRTTQTHEFMFLSPISGTQVKRLDVKVKARKYQAKAFSLELSPDSRIWLRDRQVLLSDFIETFPSVYLLVPKKQEKLNSFIEKFDLTKHQMFLSESPANIYVRKSDDQDRVLYFHAFQEMDYYGWEHKNRIAILYCDHSPIPNLYSLFPEEECDALMIVQALNGSFRFNIKCREMIVAATDCIETTREFHAPDQLMHRFTMALANCHLLYSIYPPFGPQVELQMRQQLEQHIEPFSRGIFRKFKELANKLQKTTDTINNGDDSSSIYSVENITISESDSAERKKKTVLGKVLGKLRSPLAKSSAE